MLASQIWSAQFSRAVVRASRGTAPAARHFSASCPSRQQNTASSSARTEDSRKDDTAPEEDKEEGAMARRLSQMTEDAILEGGRSAQRNIEHAGFSEELKRQLEERVKAASFKSEYAAAHSVLNMPVCSCLQTHRLIYTTNVHLSNPGQRGPRHTRDSHSPSMDRHRKLPRYSPSHARRR